MVGKKIPAIAFLRKNFLNHSKSIMTKKCSAMLTGSTVFFYFGDELHKMYQSYVPSIGFAKYRCTCTYIQLYFDPLCSDDFL